MYGVDRLTTGQKRSFFEMATMDIGRMTLTCSASCRKSVFNGEVLDNATKKSHGVTTPSENHVRLPIRGNLLHVCVCWGGGGGGIHSPVQ